MKQIIEHTTTDHQDSTHVAVLSTDKPVSPALGISLSSDQTELAHPQLLWGKTREYIRDGASEFFGTMILVLFGDGVVAQVTLSHGEKGDYQSISWGWGLGVMLGVYASGISGSHINPAVTLASCILRKFPWRKFPIYLISQVLGAMCGAAIVYGNYKSAIDIYEGGPGIRTVPGYSPNATAGIFCTYPAAFMTRTGQFFSEFIASAILMFMIFALKDDTNLGAGPLTPLALFFVVFGIGACFGWETGYAINLARDFGPRLLTYMLGYGSHVWTAGNYYFWVRPFFSHLAYYPHGRCLTGDNDQIPIIAPFLGCTFGGWMYDMFLYTGAESPVNTPYIGLRKFVTPLRPKHHDSGSHV
ncbi:aquaporin-like protein [Aspergillus transmontanensis]|uniref:Aquaporin-like protein n=1 Tax=Aspergillus transmontanensis TaxID=1034304 RepID=A0A5N6W2Y8_9EURO|nr:aquaporin-like protein [Aspergillus transmontanensis]